MNSEEKIKTTHKRVAENPASSSKKLKSELKKNYYDAVETWSKNLDVSRESLSVEDQHSTRMWANAQRDGRPAEHRWRPLFNAAKLG